jgi:hypothetical protein
VSLKHLNKSVLATCSLINYLRDNTDPVTTQADHTCSPSTYAVTDLQCISGNATDDTLTVRTPSGISSFLHKVSSTGN